MPDKYRGVIPIVDRRGGIPPGFRSGAEPRDYSEFPDEMMQSPSEMTLVPRSEWDARFDEDNETGASLEHIFLGGTALNRPAFVNLDQNGHGFCHTADTEVLTEKGFVAWSDYNWTDQLATVNPVTHAMEYQSPFEKHVYDYDGEMVYSTNSRVNFGVTPDHQMYVRKWDEKKRKLSDRYSFVKAKDIGWYAGLMHAPRGWIGADILELEIPGDRRYDGDDFFAMLGLIVSDGYAGGVDKTKNLVSFCSFREELRPAVLALVARLGGFKEAPSRQGVWNQWSAGALANWIRQNCYTSPNLKAQSKRIPEIVKCASQRQINIFLHWFNDRNRSSTAYYTSSPRLADDLQELHLRIGKRTTICKTPARESTYIGNRSGVIRGGPGFTICVSETDRLCIDRKKHIETDRYKGQVFCAAVPNHTLITRRGGTTLISSNCWAYSTGHCVMLKRLAAGLPYIRLNPHSAAAIIKGGRDEGGWAGLSAKFMRENGIAIEGEAVDQWPLHSRNTRRDTPQLRASMARFKIEEDWYDVSRREWDQKMTIDQIATQLMMNNPVAADFEWWGHSVALLRLVRIEAGSWGWLMLNSWKGWGHYGLAVIRESEMMPMGAVAIRTTTMSV